jgi:hypothetical protein
MNNLTIGDLRRIHDDPAMLADYEVYVLESIWGRQPEF